MKSPAWETIKDEINNSAAIFLLVGEDLVKWQAMAESNVDSKEKWKFTQNWISYEIGLACQKGIDVWVICDNVKINFPVPYLNNYYVWGIRRTNKKSLEWMKGVMKLYAIGGCFPINKEKLVRCQNNECGAIFNLHSQIGEKGEIVCPTCLNTILFEKGFDYSKN